MECVKWSGRRGRCARGMTLSEVMVVGAVLVVLLAIMLPSLGDARRLARTAQCSSNQRSIGLAMIAYAGEWSGAILGNPHTSSAHLFNSTLTAYAATGSTTPNEDAISEVFHATDWMAPAARMMGVNFVTGGTKVERAKRFGQLNVFKPFVCPENDLVATAFVGTSGPAGPGLPVHRMGSYTTSWLFQTVKGAGSSTAFNNLVAIPASFQITMPGYKPRILLVGNPGEKVFMADGAKWYDGVGAVNFATTTTHTTTSPGAFGADQGPWKFSTRAYATGGTAATDGRPAAMRHGKSRERNVGLARYKMNVVFFDGHVETVDGLTGSNPSWWAPAKATIALSETTGQADFRAKYCAGGMDPKIR